MARITRMTKRRLGELLLAEGLVSDEQLQVGMEEQRRCNLFLGEALVKLGFVTEEAIAHTIIQQFNLPFLAVRQYNISRDVVNIFPGRMYYEYQFIAIDKIGKVLIVVGAGLMNHYVMDELERLSGCKVCQFVSTWQDIHMAIDQYIKEAHQEQFSLTTLGTLLLDSTSAQLAQQSGGENNGGAASKPPANPVKPAVAAVSRTAAVAQPASLRPVGSPRGSGTAASSGGGETRVIPAVANSRSATMAIQNPPASMTTVPKPAVKESAPPKGGTGLLGLFKKN